MTLFGPYLAACALLVVAGAAKAARPDDTARAAAHVLGLTLTRWRWVVRLGAGAEAVLGLAGLLVVGLAVAATWVAVAASTAAGLAGWTVAALGHQPWHGVPLVLAAAACAGVAAVSMTTWGRLVAARRLIRTEGLEQG